MLSLVLAVIGTFRSKAARERWMLQYGRARLKAPVPWRASRPRRFETTSLAEVANRKRLPQAHVVLLADDKHLDLPACDRLLSRLPASTHVIHSATYNGTCARATKSYMLVSGLTVRTTLQVNPGTDLKLITLADLLRRSMPWLTIQALVEPPPGPALRAMGGSLEIPSVDPLEEDLYTLVQREGEKDKAYQALVASPLKKHEVRDNLVWRIDPETDRVCLVVPNDVAVRQRLVDRVHADAHFGAQRTYEQCRQHFVWQGMKSYIIDFVRTCPRCQLLKPSNRPAKHLVHMQEIFPYPFHTIMVDEVVGLPATSRGHNAVLTVTCQFSKYALYFPMHTDWTTHDVAKVRMDRVIHPFGSL
eukprot:scaffold581_cov453-Pavlova_lutheri.AAC.3